MFLTLKWFLCIVAFMENNAPEMLREWLETEGRKQLWLAAQLPVDRSRISLWVKGKRLPHPVNRRRIQEITGIPADLWVSK